MATLYNSYRQSNVNSPKALVSESSGRIWYVYTGGTYIAYAYSDDKTLSFTADFFSTTSPGTPQAFVDTNDNLIVVWHDTTNGYFRFRVRNKLLGTWGEIYSSVSVGAAAVIIGWDACIISNTINLVWAASSTQIKKITFSGATVSAPEELTSYFDVVTTDATARQERCYYPKCCNANGTLATFWRHDLYTVYNGSAPSHFSIMSTTFELNGEAIINQTSTWPSYQACYFSSTVASSDLSGNAYCGLSWDFIYNGSGINTYKKYFVKNKELTLIQDGTGTPSRTGIVSAVETYSDSSNITVFLVQGYKEIIGGAWGELLYSSTFPSGMYGIIDNNRHKYGLTSFFFVNAWTGRFYIYVLSTTTWEPTTNYVVGDTVYYDGGKYIATADSINQEPSSSSAYWTNNVTVDCGSVGQISSTNDCGSALLDVPSPYQPGATVPI